MKNPLLTERVFVSAGGLEPPTSCLKGKESEIYDFDAFVTTFSIRGYEGVFMGFIAEVEMEVIIGVLYHSRWEKFSNR